MWVSWLEEYPDYRTQGPLWSNSRRTCGISSRNWKAAPFHAFVRQANWWFRETNGTVERTEGDGVRIVAS